MLAISFYFVHSFTTEVHTPSDNIYVQIFCTQTNKAKLINEK